MLQTAKKSYCDHAPSKPGSPHRLGQTRRIADRLDELARKADLMALAIAGVMQLTENDDVWPLRCAADEIRLALRTASRN
jgi:hypothetical protein